MKALLTTILATSLLGSIAGCASDPVSDAAQRQLDPVEAHQINDMALSCDEIAANLNTTSSAIAAIDRQIASQQQAGNSFSLISAFAGVAGAYAPNLRSAQLADAEGTLANAGAQIEANQSVSTKDLRVMYEHRHDVLMQLFYGRNCRAG
jgi:hypothetical protein